MNTVTKDPTARSALVVVDEYLIQQARERRRISSAFIWSRVPVRYPGDQVIPGTAPEPRAEQAPVAEPRHVLGAGPDMVDIRTLVPVRDDLTSTGRHAALDPAVLAALSGARA
ncbi:MAG TPA: hypothetical protein VJ914_40280 [Pseudonocardiaceae bacterium]|nr:hypothetical protein [Pseudonocardiaceae bacterium]